MHEILDVNAGQVVVTKGAVTLPAVVAGSCIVIADISKGVSTESSGTEGEYLVSEDPIWIRWRSEC